MLDFFFCLVNFAVRCAEPVLRETHLHLIQRDCETINQIEYISFNLPKHLHVFQSCGNARRTKGSAPVPIDEEMHNICRLECLFIVSDSLLILLDRSEFVTFDFNGSRVDAVISANRFRIENSLCLNAAKL